MPRHRAPSPHPLSALAVGATGVSLGVCTLTSALLPGTALASTGPGRQVATTYGDRGHHHRDHRRPISSGELQYRNGCRQGYITEDCDQFSVTNLLRRGIDPFV